MFVKNARWFATKTLSKILKSNTNIFEEEQHCCSSFLGLSTVYSMTFVIAVIGVIILVNRIDSRCSLVAKTDVIRLPAPNL